MLGIQWHPERLLDSDARHLAPFRWLVERVSAREPAHRGRHRREQGHRARRSRSRSRPTVATSSSTTPRATARPRRRRDAVEPTRARRRCVVGGDVTDPATSDAARRRRASTSSARSTCGSTTPACRCSRPIVDTPRRRHGAHARRQLHGHVPRRAGRGAHDDRGAARRGRIVNVASEAAVQTFRYLGAYAATQVRGRRSDPGRRARARRRTASRVNAVCPGTTETDMVLAERAQRGGDHRARARRRARRRTSPTSRSAGSARPTTPARSSRGSSSPAAGVRDRPDHLQQRRIGPPLIQRTTRHLDDSTHRRPRESRSDLDD